MQVAQGAFEDFQFALGLFCRQGLRGRNRWFSRSRACHGAERKTDGKYKMDDTEHGASRDGCVASVPASWLVVVPTLKSRRSL
ncbi:hypothetical protein PY254_16875 [Rhodanobacter sp. AS-Z3]|uniref:hypothetical protein n=1 Tax=Rhodanobacter sp. AS-Z3 TaxID=3031330 RepID=UPI00247969C6|nr:hypothetical protein [Rhodanobacter sp. AS-Z3]WEN14883.1 hypothetical protein PY254_16875 [Rhodanobacter sp. AS-Z3]